MCSRSRRSCRRRRMRKMAMRRRGRGRRGGKIEETEWRRDQGKRGGSPISWSMGIEFTSVVANPGRLRILASLAREKGQEFVRLRETTRLTDGNLSAHAKRLAEAGLVLIEKRFREGKPVTSFSI